MIKEDFPKSKNNFVHSIKGNTIHSPPRFISETTNGSSNSKVNFTISGNEDIADLESRFAISRPKDDFPNSKTNFILPVQGNAVDPSISLSSEIKDDSSKPRATFTLFKDKDVINSDFKSVNPAIKNGFPSSKTNFISNLKENTVDSGLRSETPETKDNPFDSDTDFNSTVKRNPINSSSKFQPTVTDNDVIKGKSHFSSSIEGGLVSSPSNFVASIIKNEFLESKSNLDYLNKNETDSSPRKWNIREHTRASPTDSFGTIEFQGGPHPHKAHYVRLAFDSDPSDIIYLMEKIWHLPKPKLVISIHGGVGNFSIPDKFGKRFREGLLKAAQTTGAWIITSGIDSGVVKHVAQALDEAGEDLI